MSFVCPICHTHHDTTACPKVTFDHLPEPVPPTQVGKVTFGGATINGISFGEQAILDKLDEIIRQLKQMDTRM